MQLFPHSTRSFGRRSVALAGGAVLGLLTVGSLASPAQATEANVQAAFTCEQGQRVVTWTIENKYQHTAELRGLTADPADPALRAPMTLPAKSGGKSGYATVIHRIPGTAPAATLKIAEVAFSNKHIQRDVKEVTRFAQPCPVATASPSPSPSPSPSAKPECVKIADAKFRHTFDGAKGKATVSLLGDKPICNNRSQSFALASYKASKTPNSPELRFDDSSGTITTAERTITLSVNLPPCATKVYLVWGEKVHDKLAPGKGYGDRILGSARPDGNRSEGVLGSYDGGTGECGDKPVVTFEDNCRGVTILLANTGTNAAEFFGEARIGDGPWKAYDKPVKVEPGKTASLAVKGETGLAVRVTSGASINIEHKWVAPATCAASPSPTPPPPVGAPTLPVTGTSITIMSITALALLGGGAAMLVMARRRRQPSVAGVADGAARES